MAGVLRMCYGYELMCGGCIAHVCGMCKLECGIHIQVVLGCMFQSCLSVDTVFNNVSILYYNAYTIDLFI